jgi:L-threonylcarbamoyladenylate synthase
VALIGTDIDKAIELLNAGQVVGMPTETVYGLAANALDPKAASQIYAVKQRPSFDPLIIHTSDLDRVGDYVQGIPDVFQEIMTHHMPGPLTVLLEKKNIVPDLTTSALRHVAVRIPSHPLTLRLLAKLDYPLAAPSANPFGYISPTSAEHVSNQLGDKIPYILDGGLCTVGLESTIIGMVDGTPMIYRKGGMSVEQIRSYIPDIAVKAYSTSNPAAPGMLKSHYAPTIPISIVHQYSQGAEHTGFITFGEPVSLGIGSKQLELSPSRDYAEAARNLFSFMRELDQLTLTRIEVKLLPEQDLGIAINDRLRRATAK